MLSTLQLGTLIVGIPVAIVLTGVLIFALASPNEANSNGADAGVEWLEALAERQHNNEAAPSATSQDNEFDDIPDNPEAAMQWLEALAKKQGMEL